MIVSVSHLPESARQPLLLSLRLEALASLAERLKKTRCTDDETVMDGYEKHIKAAQAASLLGDFTADTLNNNPKSFRRAARNMWTVGLAQLQKAVADGWAPEDLDLSIKPENDLILTYKPSGGDLGSTKI
jgi:hypothetical protein